MEPRIWEEGDTNSTTLAAYTAHEVRNPLAALRAMAQLTLLSSDPKVREQMIHRIVSSIDELDQFLHQLLVLLRPESVSMQRVDLGSVLDSVIQLFAVQADELGADMELRLSTPSPMAWGNPDLLRHAVINLVKNALEAMPQGGPLVILAGPCERRGSVRIAVRDRGKGIPKSLQQRLLTDPGATSRASAGGIGLPFVYRVVHDIHGGKVWFRTRKGSGTLFCLEIPAAQRVDFSDPSYFPYGEKNTKIMGKNDGPSSVEQAV